MQSLRTFLLIDVNHSLKKCLLTLKMKRLEPNHLKL